MATYTAQDLASHLNLTRDTAARCLRTYEAAFNVTLTRDPQTRVYQLDQATYELLTVLLQLCQQEKIAFTLGIRIAAQLMRHKLLTVSYVALDPVTQTPQARTLEDLTNAELRLALLDTTSRLWQLTEHLTRSLPRVTPAPAPVTPALVQRPD
jgi:hypothetical protein